MTYPMAPQASATVEGHCFERRCHPDWLFKRGTVPMGTQNLDIESSVPKAVYTRVRHFPSPVPSVASA